MDSDDEREEEIQSWKGVTGSIILINVFDQLQNGTAAVAHAATCRMVRQYLRLSSPHYVGVCLYGTEDSTTSTFGIQSVTDVFPLMAPTLEEFKKLRGIDVSSYTPAKELKLSDVLWHCSKMFANCKKQLSTRSVIMLSRLDTPPIESDKRPTLKRVVDLVDANIAVKMFNISESDYKVDSFYKDFLEEANKGKDFVVPKPLYEPKEIEKVMHQQSHRHLAVARLCFEIGNGMAIGVGVYNLLSRSTYNQHKKVNLDRESNAPVTSVIKTMKVQIDTNSNFPTAMDVDEDNEPKQMPLLKSEILHCQDYGGEKINFTDAEMKKLKNPFGPPMMKLLGFKPAAVLCQEKWFLKSGQFLFPNESKIEGSTVAFKALHKACMDMSVVAICVLCTRVNSKPYIVALAPCSHPLGLDVQIGFDIINIPFVENVRDLPNIEDEEQITITEEQKILMKDTLRSIQFDYKADMFENPKLQSEYRAIEAIALDDDDVDPFLDTTKPDPGKFKDIQEELFEQLFGPFGPVASKRIASKDPSTSSKKAKVEEIDESTLKERIKYQTVHKYTVAQLKDILKTKGASDMPALNNLKKDKLVDLVYQYFEDA